MSDWLPGKRPVSLTRLEGLLDRHPYDLSGGEQQRLAFVRALIYQPSWLFLDEATSALDEETEAVMYKLVETLMPDTTIVSIGHRSSLSSFHQIGLFIDKGQHSVIERAL